MTAPSLLTLAELSPKQITRILTHAARLKKRTGPWLSPSPAMTTPGMKRKDLVLPPQTLFNKTIALIFSKRSTRTRLAAETSATLLGGKALFLGKDDIQMGVNESLRDTARVVGGSTEGIFARVGSHSEIEELVKWSPAPVINALSDLWHPTQVLADLLTLHEHAGAFGAPQSEVQPHSDAVKVDHKFGRKGEAMKPLLPPLRPLTVTYVGDCANVLNDMLVAYPRLGHTLRVAHPDGYGPPEPVMDTLRQLEGYDTWKDRLWFGRDPKEAVSGADVVVTDTWISMGQEDQKADRLRAFAGYQVTEQMCKEGGANPDWKFLHCLPRKPEEVDDEVFYGPRSLVFPEADNRRWTIMALFDLVFGKHIVEPPEYFVSDNLTRQADKKKKSKQ